MCRATNSIEMLLHCFITCKHTSTSRLHRVASIGWISKDSFNQNGSNSISIVIFLLQHFDFNLESINYLVFNNNQQRIYLTQYHSYKKNNQKTFGISKNTQNPFHIIWNCKTMQRFTYQSSIVTNFLINDT